MGKFKFSMTFTVRDITVEASSAEEAEKIARKRFSEYAIQNGPSIIDYWNEDAWNKVISECRLDVIGYINVNLEYLTKEHIKCYKEKYLSIGESAVIYHLDYEYDGNLELEYIENNTDYKLNRAELIYLTQTLKKTVINELFF